MDGHLLQLSFSSLIPYLPLVAGGLAVHVLGFLEGYLFRSWMGRANPSSFELAAKTAVAGPLLFVYVVSLVWQMGNPTYSTPMPLHALIGLVVGSLFPKRFFRSGTGGFELGMSAPDRNDDGGARNDKNDDDEAGNCVPAKPDKPKTNP